MRVQLHLKSILLSSLLLILSLTVSISHAYDVPAAVRVVHALVDVPAADFYLNEIFLGTIEYGKAAPYMQLEPGENMLHVYAVGAGTDSTPLFKQGFTLETDTHINLVLMGTAVEPQLELYTIDLTPLADDSGVSHVSLIHAVAGGDPATITATATDGTITTLATDLAFGAAVVFDLPAGSYKLNAEGLLTDAVLNSNSDMTFAVLVIGAVDGSQPIETRVFTKATHDTEPAGHPRFVHAIPEGPAVDLYLNGMLASGNMAFGRASVYFGLTPGTYTVDLYPAGSDPASTTSLLTSELTLTADLYQTVVLMNQDGQLALVALNEDTSVPPQRSSGLAVINATGNPVNLMLDGETATTDLQAGTISERVILPEGAHDLGFTSDIALTVTALDDFTVHPLTIANLKTLIVTEQEILILTDCPVIP